jgi:hypothetical protein
MDIKQHIGSLIMIIVILSTVRFNNHIKSNVRFEKRKEVMTFIKDSLIVGLSIFIYLEIIYCTIYYLLF